MKVEGGVGGKREGNERDRDIKRRGGGKRDRRIGKEEEFSLAFQPDCGCVGRQIVLSPLH